MSADHRTVAGPSELLAEWRTQLENWGEMDADFLGRRSDAEDAVGEVLPDEIITSRMPLTPEFRRLDKRSEQRPAHRAISATRGSEWMYFAILALIFLAFGGAILLDKEGRELRTLASAPLVLAELHPRISHVSESAVDDGALEITLLEVSPAYQASVVTEFASDALVVLQRLRQFFPQINNRVVRFVAKAPLHPADGDLDGQTPVMPIAFDRSTVLAKVTSPEFTFQDLLNQASAVQHLNGVSGPRYVEAFCLDEVAKSAENFCKREREIARE